MIFMILSRRQAHRYIFSALAVVLPLTFLVGTVLRPQYRALDESAAPLSEAIGFVVDSPQTSDTTILKGKGARLEVAAVSEASDRAWLYVQPTAVIKQPDLLLYWQADSEVPEELGADAILLGALSGRSRRRFALPTAMQGEAGLLVIYSNGTQKIVSALELPADLTQ